MRTKIYQIDKDTFGTKFMDYDFTMQKAGEIRPELYREVFNADIDEENLEEVYTRFNSTHHPLFRGHSLSVSDVVVNDKGAFFVDSIGFKKIDFDESKTHKPDNLMRIVYVEPHRPAFEAEIPHEYEAESKAVGGLIEVVDSMKVPDGCYRYDFREGDDGDIATLEKSVNVNFGGSVFVKEPIEIPDDGYIEMDEDSSPNFTGDAMTIAEFAETDLSQLNQGEGMGGIS